MNRCTQCVLPDTFPGISFGEDGVCSVCQEGAALGVSGASATHLRERLLSIVEVSKAEGRPYDAAVAFSGGKDSSFLLYLLKETFHLRVLAVTFDNGFLSDSCAANMRAIVAALKIDHIIIKYRQDRLNAIFLASSLLPVYPEHLTKFGSGVCISCIRMVITAALRTAIEKRIPLVMLGNSPGQVLSSDRELIYQDNKIPFALRRQLFTKLAERPGPWVYDYLMLTAEEYRTDPFPYLISPLPILGYDEDRIYRTIAELGWAKPKDVDPNSTNCRLNAFGILRHKNLYRFHPYDYEMSRLVRLGSISRDAALRKLADPEGRVVDVATQVEKDLFCASCGKQHGSCS